MKNPAPASLECRLDKMEIQLRRERYIFLTTIVLGLVFYISTAAKQPHAASAHSALPDSTAIIKVRGLIIQDEHGKDRIILGAPMPDAIDGPRVSASTGMAILDPQGYERFGLGIDDNNQMGMGFDAPPGTGDPRNRERINIVADAYGGALIRFLNRKTQVVSMMQLDGDDQFYLNYVDWSTDKILRRKISFAGDETVEWK